MNGPDLELLMEKARAGAIVLTVNARLSRLITAAYDRAMAAKGLSAWATPSVMPLSAWVKRLWEESFPAAPLLGGERGKALWEKIITGDGASSSMLSEAGVADSAYCAYSLLKEYGIRLPEEEIYLTEEAKALKRWTASYEGALKRLGFMDESALFALMTDELKKGNMPVPAEAVLAGFDELAPATLALMDALKARGAVVSFWPGEPGQAPASLKPSCAIKIKPFENSEEEVRQASRWARKAVKSGARIGFIVPELQRYRDLIAREFRAELDPASVIPWERGTEAVFNISLGESLDKEPLVRSALSILSMGTVRVEMDELTPILLSPFLWTGEEMAGLASMDVQLREKNSLMAGLKDVRERAGGGRVGKTLDFWLGHLSRHKGRELPGKWAHAFSAFLKDLGWLSTISLSSREYQALKAWNGALERLASFDEILGRIKREEAVARLRRICAEMVHQPETGEASIQVMGLLESAGQSFDQLWIMGCHENALPPSPSPNPFIPLYIQRQYNIPHSSHERELAFTRTVLERIFSNAPSITVSYPRESEGRELQLSPLLAGLGDTDEAGIIKSSRLKDAVFDARAIEEFVDDEPVPVGKDELESIRGGTQIIKNQSLCPFKAFATHRLNAKEIASPELGLSPGERGDILHRALKLFWERVDGSESLRALRETGEIDRFITEITAEVFKEIRPAPPLSVRFLALERERLASLLMAWVEVESRRGPFKVKRIELETEVDLFGLKIRQRPDRIDELKDGGEAIIDYKTGRVEKRDWVTARPKDPQLLVYSVLGRYDAISFARVAPGECGFLGVARFDGALPGVKELERDGKFMEKAGADGWDGLMALWKGVVEGLAKEFLDGAAAVDPVDSSSQQGPCHYCPLPVLCRVSDGINGEEGEDDSQ